MKTTSSLIFLGTLILIRPFATVAQSAMPTKKNTIEVFFPVSHFFDGTNTNWGLWAERRSNYYYDANFNLVSFDQEYKLPATLGIQYLRRITPNSRLSASAQWYGRGYNYGKDKVSGEVVERIYSTFSVGYLHALYGKHKFHLEALAGINFRNGYETVHIYYPNWFEARSESLEFRDWGLSAGLRAAFDLPWHLVFSIEAKYTRFVFLSDGGVDFFGDHKDPTPNTLTYQIALGYRF